MTWFLYNYVSCLIIPTCYNIINIK